MSEQRIDTGAAAATGKQADVGEGQGLQRAGAHGDHVTTGEAGSAGDQPVPGAEERGAPSGDPDTADTEGGRNLQETADMAEGQQEPPD